MKHFDWKSYSGSGIRPQDFDAFWEDGLQEMKSLPLAYKLEIEAIPSQIASFYHLTFIGVGGAEVHCQLVTPKFTAGKKLKGMLQFHGYHGDSGDFQDKVGWVAEGFVVLAMDARGQGGLSEDCTKTKGGIMKGLIIRGLEEGKENLYYRQVFLDTAHAARILKSLDFVDESRIYAQGASQGGGLTIACAGLVPDLYRIYVTYPFLSDYRKAYALGAQTSAFEEIPYWFQFRDPLHKREKEVFDTLEYIDIQHFAPSIQAEVCWIVGLQDAVVPPITQMAAYNKITARKQLVELPEYGHEYLPKVSDELRGYFVE
ncbi:acetylxylan esterase [Enterococcus casseliflavus]|uniref:Acetylxylan esterase n=1 Tax=Enterococcus casseliflavus TaxID=37734 RepID=A0AAW8UUG6_ENTCA|nr:acetylxylan esterase [Enterococcus casseliflavus]MBE9880979.1 acetylxylan esterase [Enterococcus casseliflavus]MDT2966303.1 acetylxylan esterase [Enterococcus casseliflavus]MDT2990792.1 acetylxylan esterase [Enterococcus casseliflavus]